MAITRQWVRDWFTTLRFRIFKDQVIMAIVLNGKIILRQLWNYMSDMCRWRVFVFVVEFIFHKDEQWSPVLSLMWWGIFVWTRDENEALSHSAVSYLGLPSRGRYESSDGMLTPRTGTKWSPFCRSHCQMHSLKRSPGSVIQISLKCVL